MRAVEGLFFLTGVGCERPGELSAFAACATGQPPVMASAPPSAPIPFSKRRRDGSFTSWGFCCAIDLGPDPGSRAAEPDLPPGW